MVRRSEPLGIIAYTIVGAYWYSVRVRTSVAWEKSDPMSKFNCEKCPGYCCSHPRIAVTDHDIRRLAKHFGISELAARKRYTYSYTTDGVREQLLRHHKDTIYKSVCRLFDRETRRCTVYPARPYVCRQYPYGKTCGYYEFLKFERAHHGDEEHIPTF
jgi:Fe-S-cluster containining protein